MRIEKDEVPESIGGRSVTPSSHSEYVPMTKEDVYGLNQAKREVIDKR
jgi:hypothetical protein